jgi:hypothetical protein
MQVPTGVSVARDLWQMLWVLHSPCPCHRCQVGVIALLDGPGSGLPEKQTPNSPWDACHGRRAPLNGMRHCDAAAFFGG